MKKRTASYLYFLAGILAGVASIINFTNGEKWFGRTYIFVAITFISLGFTMRKKDK